ncbi:uncharacterized protein BYT42DRAFT_542593 [Radiomyces spectabilis]|uniref:uncharacterized protein n=1 Tax=Radiomyces spectabilis TaxID=64574 RepID=UPI0022210A3A|nr:uncharacterized protein BYT42DRAFT_542593 [Radiomyces spectabilis]KAI8390958.1 hypothetical protein BYT42DRAFT_542593 [Radiomyces spectabilis]
MTMTKALVLGSYGTPPTVFQLYHLEDKHISLLCVEDLHLFFCDTPPPPSASSVFQQLTAAHSHQFRQHENQIFISTHIALKLARRLNLYLLAELCKLSHGEITAGVSEPLLRSIPTLRCATVPHWDQVHFELEPLSDTLAHYDFALATEQQQQRLLASRPYTQQPSQHSSSPYQHHPPPPPPPPQHTLPASFSTSSMKEPWENYLTQSLSETTLRTLDPSTLQAYTTAQKIKRQQLAIIECRQRQTLFATTKKPLESSQLLVKRGKKAKYITIATPPISSSSYSPQKLSPLSTPQQSDLPSPPILVKPLAGVTNLTHFSASYSHSLPQQRQQPPPPLLSQHQPHPRRRRISLNHSAAEPLSNLREPSVASRIGEKRPHDNLDLLATQATKMRVLPMSPSVSPPPPTTKLPPIKDLLADLAHRFDHFEQHSVNLHTSTY